MYNDMIFKLIFLYVVFLYLVAQIYLRKNIGINLNHAKVFLIFSEFSMINWSEEKLENTTKLVGHLNIYFLDMIC